MKPITVLLVDDHEIVREGLAALLGTEADILVVGQASSGRQAVQLVKQLAPDVVVMDLAMPLLNGLEATRQVLKNAPATKVLVLSAHGDDEYVERAVEIGAAGYLIKQSSALILPKAIRAIQSGNQFFDTSIARRRRERERKSVISGTGHSGAKAVHLTSREVEVLQLIAEGKANKQTADELGISIKTVEKHRQHLMSKLDIHDTAGLTRYAIAAGIIDSGVRFTVE